MKKSGCLAALLLLSLIGAACVEEHPTLQTHISDKPDAPNVKFITQLVCVETG